MSHYLVAMAVTKLQPILLLKQAIVGEGMIPRPPPLDISQIWRNLVSLFPGRYFELRLPPIHSWSWVLSTRALGS